MADSLEQTLRSIIEVLHDGHKGFAEIGHHLKDQGAKDLFLKESLNRQQFAGDIEQELHRHGVADIKEGGTAAGTVLRVWGDLKAHLGGGDHTLFATAEQAEDEVKRAYKNALDRQDLPVPVRQMLATQQAHIWETHDKVKALRDAKS